MSLWNLSISLSSIVGGRIYESWALSMGADNAFKLLVFVGAGFTAIGWVVVFFIPREEDTEYNIDID